MKKKIQIGIILALAILIGASLTSVVGYQSVESNFRESPLFNVRSVRAIEKDRNIVTCNYFEQEEKYLISLPEPNIHHQKEFDIINKIDDRTFNRFVILAMNNINSKYDIQEYSNFEIIQMVNQFRTNPKIMNQNPINESLPSVISYCGSPCPTVHGGFGCWLLDLIWWVFFLITSLFE